MNENTLSEGIYGLLLATSEKVEIVEEYNDKILTFPKSYKEFKDLNEEDLGFLLGSMAAEAVVLNSLSQLYQAKRTAMNILINQEASEDSKIEIKMMSEILEKGFLDIDGSEKSIEDAFEEIENKF